MITVTLRRARCIGCQYCCEHAPRRFAMSKKDGKAVLLQAREKNGFHLVRVHEEELEALSNAANACPVRIIRMAGNL